MLNRPTFVLILADDLGCADLGCYGGRFDGSPSLDRLATVDGVDLFGPEVDRAVFWRMLYRNQKAARRGPLKYLSIDGAERDGRERANVRFRQPERLRELRAAYREWDASMPAFPEDARYELVYRNDAMARSSG